MNKQKALDKLQAVVEKAGGFVRLETPLQFTVWCAGNWTDIKVCAIVSMAKDSHLNDRGELVTNAELYAIAEDYTVWNVEDFFNEAQLETIINKFGRTVEIEYRMKVTVNGFDMKDIADKFCNLQLSDKSQGTEFVEMIGVWDAETCEEVTDEFDEVY